MDRLIFLKPRPRLYKSKAQAVPGEPRSGSLAPLALTRRIALSLHLNDLG